MLIALFSWGAHKVAAATIMVYVQRFEDDRLHHIALEDGLMSSLFASGHIVVNVSPQDALLLPVNDTYSLWLRTLAADIGADHVLFVQYQPTTEGKSTDLYANYLFIHIAEPGNIAEGDVRISYTPARDIKILQRSSYQLGEIIIQKMLTIWK